MPITDLTGYTWVGNDNLIINESDFGYSYNINFTSNYTNYSIFEFYFAGFAIFYKLNSSNYPVYIGDDTAPDLSITGTWSNSEYQTIQITGGADVTNQTLISWLEANGTLTAPTPAGTNNVSIGTLKLAKAFVGNSEIVSMWLGDAKIYEKG